MESSERLQAWIYQQRDAFRHFFAAVPTADGPHVSQLVANTDIAYLGPGALTEAYVGRSHCMKSLMLPLYFTVCGEPVPTVFVSAPADNGVFTVNGKAYTTPLQRLIWQVEPHRIEYRRLDQALLDGWARRLDGAGERSRTRQTRAAGQPAQVVFEMLAAYLVAALTPTRRGERLFLLLDKDLNWLGVLARQTQVMSLRVGWDEDEEWVPGITRYNKLWRSTQLGKSMRVLRGANTNDHLAEGGNDGDSADLYALEDAGLDVFHTPEGGDIGLTRYLTCDAFVDDRRRLRADPSQTCGLIAALLPFAQHNDGRRLTMACGMLTHSVPLDNGGPPVCQTAVERLVLGSVPGARANLGVDLRVGFMFWDGLNYEDAIVLSQTAQAKLHIEERCTVRVSVPCFCEFEPLERGSEVHKGQLLGLFHFSPTRLALGMPTEVPEAERRELGFFPEQIPWQGSYYRSPCRGFVENVVRVDLWAEDCPGAARFSGRVDFTIVVDRPLQIGDKLCNRHGNKGVVAAILPDERMPQVDGNPLEILFNPVGVVNRGNYGQLLEALAAPDAHGDMAPDVCDDPGRRLRSLLASEEGRTLRYSVVTIKGADGYTKVQAVTGLNYILRLPHYATDQMSVTSKGVYSSITEQPPAGQGQKYGEMEIAALQAHGAHAILSSLCQSRSRQVSEAGVPIKGIQRPIFEGLRAAGLLLQITDTAVALSLADLVSTPELGTDLFAPGAKSGRDLSCNVAANEKRAVPIRVILRRLSSRGFFDDNPGVYLDLGRTVELVLGPEAGEHPPSITVRYLPVLHPKYRPPGSGGAGRNETAAHYERLVVALWRTSAAVPAKAAEDGGIKRALGVLLGHLRSRLRDKHGVVRCVGLSRRLTYSGRFVIVPGPELAVDEVSLPWDAVRVLFRQTLQGAGVPEAVVDTPTAEIPASEQVGLGIRVDGVLESSWVLLNRNPSLHRYSILSFRPRTHFDTDAMRLPPLVTPPFGADFDGDLMSVVPLLEQEARDEALGLSVACNQISDANGMPTVPLAKDFRLGLWLTMTAPAALDALNRALAAGGAPLLKSPATDADASFADAWQRSLHGLRPEQVVQALRLVSEHGLKALRKHTAHSCFGDAAAMEQFLASMLDSGAAKRDVLARNCDLVTGVPMHGIRSRGMDCTGIMVSAKIAVGNFGGYNRRLYYRLRPCAGTGLAFDGAMRSALIAIQSITERATQRALGAKSAATQLGFSAFQKAVAALLKCGSGDFDPARVQEFVDMIGLDEPSLRRHLSNLAPLLEHELPENSFMRFLAKQTVPRVDGTTVKLLGDRHDPRIALFLS